MKIMFHIIWVVFIVSSTSGMAYPKIKIIKDNTNYLLIQENSLPIVDINISFNTGSKDDGSLKGLTNYTIELLHQQKIDGEKIIDSFEKIGAIYNSSVGRDTSSLSVRFVKNDHNMRIVSKKLNEIFKDGNLSASSIEYTRELISKRIASRDLNPASIVSYKSDEEFFVDTGYSHPISGYMDIIQKIDIVDIQRHLKKIISINNIKISIVGDINEKETAHFISKLLNGVSEKNGATFVKNKLKYEGNDKVKTINHDSSQTHILIYIPSVTRQHKNFYNILVANYIFGGSGFGSMLMQEIRENNGLAYSVYSYLLPYKDIGVIKIGMQTESKNTNKALKILKTEINKLKIFNIDDERIEKAKSGLLKSFELRFDTNKNMLRTLSSINDYEMYDNYFETYTKGINLVTKESIMSSLQSDLQFEKMLITTVGNN